MDSDSSDAISTSSSDEIEIDNSTKSPTKVYTRLQNVNSTPPMSDISSGSSSIRLEFTSSGDNTSPSPPSSQSSYGKYSTTYPPSHTSSINSSPTATSLLTTVQNLHPLLSSLKIYPTKMTPTMIVTLGPRWRISTLMKFKYLSLRL